MVKGKGERRQKESLTKIWPADGRGCNNCLVLVDLGPVRAAAIPSGGCLTRGDLAEPDGEWPWVIDGRGDLEGEGRASSNSDGRSAFITSRQLPACHVCASNVGDWAEAIVVVRLADVLPLGGGDSTVDNIGEDI